MHGLFVRWWRLVSEHGSVETSEMLQVKLRKVVSYNRIWRDTYDLRTWHNVAQ
jgi:hypothetical protein